MAKSVTLCYVLCFYFPLAFYVRQTLIEEGAVELVVPGNLPIGCSAVYLTYFPSLNKTDYDPRNGCLKEFNAFAKYHNNQLKGALATLREKYPHARIIYADYYGPAMRFFHAPRHHGQFYLECVYYCLISSCNINSTKNTCNF